MWEDVSVIILYEFYMRLALVDMVSQPVEGSIDMCIIYICNSNSNIFLKYCDVSCNQSAVA